MINASRLASRIASFAPETLRAWGYHDLADEVETGWARMMHVAQQHDCLRVAAQGWDENSRIEYPCPPLTDEQIEAVYDIIAQFQSTDSVSPPVSPTR